MSGATCGACRFRREPRISRSLSSGGASRRPVGSSGPRLLFRRDRKRWRLRQQCCLEVAPRPAMLAWSMRRVGLIDITVGNAARLGTSLGASQRSTTRRCASHHIATQRVNRWGHPAALARSARTVTLKRLWLRDGYVQRAHSLSPNPGGIHHITNMPGFSLRQAHLIKT